MTSKAGSLTAAVLVLGVVAIARAAVACEFGATVPAPIQEATCQRSLASSRLPPSHGLYDEDGQILLMEHDSP